MPGPARAQVLPSGRFVRERTLGRFLRDDDELVLRQALAAELRWRCDDPQVRSVGSSRRAGTRYLAQVMDVLLSMHDALD